MNPPSQTTRLFRPASFLIGLVLGFLALVLAGRFVGHTDWHPNFVRFHPHITSETLYEPTIGELSSIIRANCRPDQILVVVGGNSIFQGVGQPVDRVWTRHLQELLGDRYAVINLAFRGAYATDGAAFAAEAMRKEFPRQIYLANIAPLNGSAPVGSDTYRFMFFDAYYKGLLTDFRARDDALENFLAHPHIYEGIHAKTRLAKVDAALRFRDFWTWWSANLFFTFPTERTPDIRTAFKPRNAFPDIEPDFETIPFEERFSDRFAQAEMEIARNYTAIYYEKDAAGAWKLFSDQEAGFHDNVRNAFPDELKPRTLLVVSRNSPYYTRQLPDDIRARDELAIRHTLAGWREAGHASIDYGLDFADTDYGDRTHLTVSGGRKLAKLVAAEIESMSERLGYLSR